MKAASYSSHRRLGASRLMKVDRESAEIKFSSFASLNQFLSPKDVLVMNTSATVPASFKSHAGFEIRLAAYAGDGSDFRDWYAVSFGEGSWRIPTEARGPAPRIFPGEIIVFGENLRASVRSVEKNRLLKLHFEGPNYLSEIYAHGKPIQYSYHRDELAIWDIQTPLAQMPFSVEPPSALLPFDWRHLQSLKANKAYLVHGAGLSSTGDTELDRLLPLPEFFHIPLATQTAIARAKSQGGKVIAVGTTVARALEGSALMQKASGTTDFKLGAHTPLNVIDGLLTGYHEPGTSHFHLEESLMKREILEDAFQTAFKQGFLGHEFGDAVLIL